MNKYILGVVGVLIVVTILFFTSNNSWKFSTDDSGIMGGNNKLAPSVSYTNEGFVPAELTVKQGEVVTFTNQSSEPMWVASNPHPIHTLYPGFDEKAPVSKGGSYSFTFDKVGTHPYHNHFHPGNQGTIIVE